MKKSLISISIVFLVVLFLGCISRVPVAMESGKADVAYLIFVSDKWTGQHVEVTLTNPAYSFRARTIKNKRANRDGIQYQVGTGKRGIKVYRNGALLYQNNILLSPQETKIIEIR